MAVRIIVYPLLVFLQVCPASSMRRSCEYTALRAMAECRPLEQDGATEHWRKHLMISTIAHGSQFAANQVMTFNVVVQALAALIIMKG
ncbi:MAG: hypothetical protein ACR2QJ_17500 [Geminicoccaceae bacterium]